MKEVDSSFYDRADAHIHLSNEQLARTDVGAVSASMIYGTARFNAMWSAGTCESREQFTRAREEILAYLCEQYRMMLEDHLDDCAANFDRYMSGK